MGVRVLVVLCLGLSLFQGCSCSDNTAHSPGDGGSADLSAAVNTDGAAPFDDLAGTTGDGSGNHCVPPSALTVTPGSTSATVQPGMPYTLSFTVTASYSGAPDADVTVASFISASDSTIGSFTGGTFTWGGDHGGAVVVTASHCGQTATAMLSLTLSAAIPTGTVDPSMAMTRFGGAATGNASCNPTLLYPPDGVLFPPNTNVIEVHFTLGTPANDLFEVSFSNAVTDVKVYTACTGATAADGLKLNGGCVFELNQAEWNYVAHTNRERAPVTVKVRGVGCDGTNVGASATRAISFARDDLVGALYYWSSIDVGGANPYSGGVFRYDFGVRAQVATPVLTPTNLPSVNPGFCVGCHDISRDGRQMVFDYDDNDGDDEYGDVSTDIFDIVQQKTAVQDPLVKGGSFPPGFHTWNRETTEFLLSDGPGGTAMQLDAFRRVDPLGHTQGYAKPGTLRGTTPDWAPDDSAVVFAAPPNVKTNPPTAGFWLKHMGTADDEWFAGASLYTAPWDPMMKKLGSATALVTATGTQNYYYPSFSPDGSLIAFNYAPDGPNFHNPKARVRLVAAAQSNPVPLDLAKANQADGLTNSWARWSPFVQSYQGSKLLWITFSSTRNYGLRIVNDGLTNCYPSESPSGFRAFTGTPNPACTKTQIWMAAVRLDANMVMAGTDVSWPAFWLPFQDLGHNNHLAQWAQRSYTGKCTQTSDCGMGQCCDNGGCTTCSTPPPLPTTCNTTPNCDPDQCCQNGQCGGCTGGGGPGPGCNTCLDCPGQACVNGACGACTDTSQCCAPYVCQNGACLFVIP